VPAQTLQQVETFLGAKVEDYLTFVGNVGIGASYDGAKLQLGLAATVTDETTAQTRVTGLISALRLGAMAANLPITVSDATVNGTTVSTIDFGSYPGLPANLPIDTKVTIAVGGGHLYIGLGNFAATALARTQADSLAGNPRYSSAISAAGAGATTVYADIAALRTDVEKAMPSNPAYTTNIQPYLAPFDRLVVTSSGDSSTLTAHLLLFVK
jgi:hypothetical protein